mgnify:CR=1 FL=1
MINGSRKITCLVRDMMIPRPAFPIEVKNPEDKNPQIIFCEFKVQIASAAKHADNLMWKDLEAQEKECGNDRTCCCRITICLTNTVVFFSSIVKAPDWLSTLSDANADRKKNHIYF